MHEVINFACSHTAGHVVTHLYNVQESHIPYSKKQPLTHSNDVFLDPVKVNGRTNYYPRSISVEFAGGYGFLSKYEYREPKTALETIEAEVVAPQKQHPKSEFQQQLDSGKAGDPASLTAESTAFWTSYNKLIYRPSSLVEVPNFKHPNGTHKHFARLGFADYPVGQDEWQQTQDAVDDTFRRQLEMSDLVQGVNFFAETDNAWGGFTGDMITELRDEYFNNGVSSKHCLWVYGMQTGTGTEALLARIRSFAEFAANSTLFVPLQLPQQAQPLLTPEFSESSLWHRSAVLATVVNAVWGLNCQISDPVRMATIESGLLKSYEKRNIVNEVFLREAEQAEKTDAFGVADDPRIMQMYLTGTPAPPSELSLGLNHGPSRRKFAVASVQREKKESDAITEVYTNPYLDELAKCNTFPRVVEHPDSVHPELGVSTSLKETVKDYRKIVQRVRSPKHVGILGDRSELVEQLSAIIEEYTVGYSDESDYE